MTNQWKHPWMEWVVSVWPTSEWEQTFLPFNLRSLIWATRLKRVSSGKKEEKAAKGKASRMERGGNYSGPKYCVGKGSVAVLALLFLFFFSLRKSCKNHSRGGGKARHEEAGHKGKIIPYPNRISRITFYNRRRGPSQSKGPLEINYFNYIGWMSEWLSPFSGHVEITGLLSGSKSIDGP